MSESLFASITPTGNAQDPNSPRTLGFDFQAAVPGQITAIPYWWDPLTGTFGPATINVALFDPSVSTVTPLGTGTSTPTGVEGWKTVPLTAAVNIVANHTYTACAWISLTAGATQPNYDFINGGLASNVTVGDLTALAGTGRSLNNTPSLTYPTNLSNFNFFVDIVFNPGAAPTATPGPLVVSTQAKVVPPPGPILLRSQVADFATFAIPAPLLVTQPARPVLGGATVAHPPLGVFVPPPAFHPVIFTVAAPRAKWTITLQDLRVSSLSNEPVAFTVATSHNGQIYNPTAATVTAAFLPAWGNPQVADWQAATWTGNAIGGFEAECDIGPAGAALAPGTYYAWLKVDDSAASGDVPIVQAGTVVVE